MMQDYAYITKLLLIWHPIEYMDIYIDVYEYKHINILYRYWSLLPFNVRIMVFIKYHAKTIHSNWHKDGVWENIIIDIFAWEAVRFS